MPTPVRCSASRWSAPTPAGASWWYSTNNGTDWLAMGSVSEASARLLSADAGTRLYFPAQPGLERHPRRRHHLRAWDAAMAPMVAWPMQPPPAAARPSRAPATWSALTVNAVDDAPVVEHPRGGSTPTENASVVVDDGLTVVDADGGNLAGATVAITGGL